MKLNFIKNRIQRNNENWATTTAAAMALPQNRKAIPQAGIVCGTCDTEFKSPALQCQSAIKCYHQTLAEMPLYYMVKYAQSTIKFQCKQCTEQLVQPNWTDTAHLFRDCYINSINIENRHDLNDTDVPTGETRIESQTVKKKRQTNLQKKKDHKVMMTNMKLIR